MSGRTPTVYVIDDDSSVRKSLSRLLKAADFEVTACESAQQFLEPYDPDVPGCLVLDLTMPEVSGLDLQNALVERGGAPPIVFLTGRADIPCSVQAMKR